MCRSGCLRKQSNDVDIETGAGGEVNKTIEELGSLRDWLDDKIKDTQSKSDLFDSEDPKLRRLNEHHIERFSNQSQAFLDAKMEVVKRMRKIHILDRSQRRIRKRIEIHQQ